MIILILGLLTGLFIRDGHYLLAAVTTIMSLAVIFEPDEEEE